MSVKSQYRQLEELVAATGEMGRRLSEIAASKGAAGNISCFYGWDLNMEEIFSNSALCVLRFRVMMRWHDGKGEAIHGKLLSV